METLLGITDFEYRRLKGATSQMDYTPEKAGWTAHDMASDGAE